MADGGSTPGATPRVYDGDEDDVEDATRGVRELRNHKRVGLENLLAEEDNRDKGMALGVTTCLTTKPVTGVTPKISRQLPESSGNLWIESPFGQVTATTGSDLTNTGQGPSCQMFAIADNGPNK